MLWFHCTISNCQGWGSGSTLARTVNMVCDQEIDGSSQLSSVCFDHVDNLHSKCESIYIPTRCSQCCQLVQQRPCHVLSCLCDYACKRSPDRCRRVEHCVPIAGFSLFFTAYICWTGMLIWHRSIQTKNENWLYVVDPFTVTVKHLVEEIVQHRYSPRPR